jgi:hypothetical protein
MWSSSGLRRRKKRVLELLAARTEERGARRDAAAELEQLALIAVGRVEEQERPATAVLGGDEHVLVAEIAAGLRRRHPNHAR